MISSTFGKATGAEASSAFGQSVAEGNPQMREQTPKNLRSLQMVYRYEQVRQLEQQLREWGLKPHELEFHAVDFEKNMCPSTGFENESGVLYNKRTGVSVPVVLEWACEWNCGPDQWQGREEIGLHTCHPTYFFVGLNSDNRDQLL